MTNRSDVRLDAERRRRLEELAEENGVAISEVVRRLIDCAYEDTLRARRKQAVERLIGLNVEDPRTRKPFPASWRPPMNPAVFIDANVPIYALARSIPVSSHAPGFSAYWRTPPVFRNRLGSPPGIAAPLPCLGPGGSAGFGRGHAIWRCT